MEVSEDDFTRLVKEHKSTIYTVCLMFSKEKEDIDDLFQEVLINLWRGIKTFRGECKTETWIWRVSLNTCITADRRCMRRSRALPLLSSAQLSGGDIADDRQVRMLHDRIRRLRPFDRAIVLLWLEDISYEEIAAIVGVTPKNVSVRLFRIKEELKRMPD